MKKKISKKLHNAVLELVTVIMTAVFAATVFSLTTGSIALAVLFLVSMAWLLFFTYANMFRKGGAKK